MGPLDIGSPPSRPQHDCGHRYYAPLRLPRARFGSLRSSLASRYLDCFACFVSRQAARPQVEATLRSPGDLVSRFPPGCPALVQGDQRLSQVPELPLGMHAPSIDPGGVAGTWSLVPETAAFQRLYAVGIPSTSTRNGSTTIGISRLNHAACILAPLGPAPRLTATHASFATDLLTRLWPGGTRKASPPHPLGSNNQFHRVRTCAILQFQGFGFNLTRTD